MAIVGKLFGAALAARVGGFDWRASAVIGTLMNTRGLTELIVLNLALEKGVISDALFAMLVIMALVTTFMAGPLLRLLDPKNETARRSRRSSRRPREGRPPSSPTPRPGASILVAPQTDAALPQLLALAEPLASSEPPRELILARLVRPPAAHRARRAQTENALLPRTSREIAEAGASLPRPESRRAEQYDESSRCT